MGRICKTTLSERQARCSVKGIEKMIRMYLLQVWFNLSDEGIENVIYDSYTFRKLSGISFTEERVPNATTLLKVRHLLEKNHIGEQMFKTMITTMTAAAVINFVFITLFCYAIGANFFFLLTRIMTVPPIATRRIPPIASV